jgi:Zn-dependent peptidase ImmA (M78 family)/transcriptional regulator with XRE-family HTH domain
MPAVSPEVLRWARETAGLTEEAAARKIGLNPTKTLTSEQRIVALENGEVEPSDHQLRRIAEVYRRPLLTFYLDRPPARDKDVEDFRTVPDKRPDTEGLVAALLRDMRARQATVRELMEDDEAEPVPWVGAAGVADGVPSVATRIVETLRFDLTTYRRAKTPALAFEYLRSLTEGAGVFVLLVGDLGHHTTTLDTETFRGFAIADPMAPFVVINNNDARAAWSFTLLHELTHIFLGITGVSGARAEAKVEQFCNEVASQILMPNADMAKLDFEWQAPIDVVANEVGKLADALNLSRTLVALRLHQAGLIKVDQWTALRQIFRAQWLQGKERERAARQEQEQDGGPNYYVVRRHRLGRALLEFVGRMVVAGTLTPVKAGKVLGVKPRSVEPLLRRVA